MNMAKKTKGRGVFVNKIENAWSEWQFNCICWLSATAHFSKTPAKGTVITSYLMAAFHFNSR